MPTTRHLGVVFVALLGSQLWMSALCVAQKDLRQIFTDLHSVNPEVREAANSQIVKTVVESMPKIEDYSDSICPALTDADEYIRLQASGIVRVVLTLHPNHRRLVQICVPQLFRAANDEALRVRENALAALALSPDGPPSGSDPIFSAALKSDSERLHIFAALGLIRSASFTNQEAPLTDVVNALRRATTADDKQGLLAAVAKGNLRSKSLFSAVEPLLYDQDPEVQSAAVDATAVSAPSKQAARSTLGNSSTSPHVSAAAREKAKIRISQIPD